MTTTLQTKFQKGDLVYFARNTDGFLEGDLAEILTATVTSVIISFKGQFINQWFNNSDFEKVAPDLEKPKFQRGDVVQFKGDSYGSSKGLRAIVLQATETNLIIERKGKFINRWFDNDEFELAPPYKEEAPYVPTLSDKIFVGALRLIETVFEKFDKISR